MSNIFREFLHLKMSTIQSTRCLIKIARKVYAECVPIISREYSSTQDAKVMSENYPHWMNEAVLYVHWPFCKRRCTYCNFNKYIENKEQNEDMTKYLVKELQTLISISGIKRINSIFFGGGTPSLADPGTFERIIDEVNKQVYMSADAEISMEANPTALEAEKLVSFKSAGINRISIGLQALDQTALKVLGRDHSVTESIHVLHHAKKLFPGRTSIDVMFARPGQMTSSWLKELEKVLKHADNHISLYQLTLERGTELFNWHHNGEITIPENDTCAEMYRDAVCVLSDAGYERYEVSNFARPGAESRHNQAYWSGSQYLGIGPGAHGRFVALNQHMYPDTSVQRERKHDGYTTHDEIDSAVVYKSGGIRLPAREARIQTLEPSPWMKEVDKYGHGTRRRVKQSVRDVLQELIMLGMRTKIGISNKIWMEYSNGISLNQIFHGNDVVKVLEEHGLVEISDEFFKPTASGLTVADSVTTELILTLDKYCEDKLSLNFNIT